MAFRYLAECVSEDLPGTKFAQLFLPSQELDQWMKLWKTRIGLSKHSAFDLKNSMLQKNPAFIPRNHWVDKAIQHAEAPNTEVGNSLGVVKNNFNLAEKLLNLVTQPFSEPTADNIDFTYPPKPEERIKNTFCGT